MSILHDALYRSKMIQVSSSLGFLIPNSSSTGAQLAGQHLIFAHQKDHSACGYLRVSTMTRARHKTINTMKCIGFSCYHQRSSSVPSAYRDLANHGDVTNNKRMKNPGHYKYHELLLPVMRLLPGYCHYDYPGCRLQSCWWNDCGAGW